MSSLTKIIIAAISFLGFGCNDNDPSFIINYYMNNENYNIKLSEKESKDIYSLFKDLIYESDDMLKLIVLPETIPQIKEKESAIEIVFNNPVYLETKSYGKIKSKKVLIPLSGEFIGIEDEMTTVFYGEEDDYSSGPLRNSNGLPLLEKINKILTEKIK